jgi:glyoxylate carboligase
LIRQNQRYAYEYEYAVDLTYDNASDKRGLDFVRLAEAFGAYGERVIHPDEIRPAFERAVKCGKPAVLDIVVERETNASMGVGLDAIREFA